MKAVEAALKAGKIILIKYIKALMISELLSFSNQKFFADHFAQRFFFY
jgi:hypothetical protein